MNQALTMIGEILMIVSIFGVCIGVGIAYIAWTLERFDHSFPKTVFVLIAPVVVMVAIATTLSRHGML